MTRTAQIVIAVISILAASALIFSQLPTQGFQSDLSRVGNGTPTVVLGFQNHSPIGIQAMDVVNQVRSDYEDRADFIIADLTTDEGMEFAESHGTQDGYIGVFSDGGERQNVYELPEYPQALRQILERELGY